MSSDVTLDIIEMFYQKAQEMGLSYEQTEKYDPEQMYEFLGIVDHWDLDEEILTTV